MEKRISVVIPNYNKAENIGKCLNAVFSSRYKNLEVVVVDDNSEDGSADIIKQFPCKLIRLAEHSGTSKARNLGARHSSGEIIFFTDADCLLQEDTLSIINETFISYGVNPPASRCNASQQREPSPFRKGGNTPLNPLLIEGKNPHGGVIIGGTYTRMPFDTGFFSIFQSVFINYSETKNIENPDYIAAHAMIIDPQIFEESGGFPEDFLPIIEDVEFSHRLRRMGYKLIMNPDIRVRHIFDFSFAKSMRNAFRKSRYWNMYSLGNRDLLTDSGAASVELKTSAASFFLSIVFLSLGLFLQEPVFLYLLPLLFLLNAYISRGLIKAFYETKGGLFAGLSFMYFSLLYPLPVGMGALSGVIQHVFKGNYQRIYK
ncbi:MAG: glycosyltransferase [Nitrospirae bacterium]|nr:glycosyltransferase [Nitrospirota bacterium]